MLKVFSMTPMPLQRKRNIDSITTVWPALRWGLEFLGKDRQLIRFESDPMACELRRFCGMAHEIITQTMVS
jgi:hypothetical protein